MNGFICTKNVIYGDYVNSLASLIGSFRGKQCLMLLLVPTGKL